MIFKTSYLLVVLSLSTTINVAYSGIAVPTQRILQGPSTKTKVIGPDGSVIEAIAPGGTIVLDDNAGPVAQAIPIVKASAAVPQSLEALEAKNVVPLEPTTLVTDGKIPVTILTVTEKLSVRINSVSEVPNNNLVQESAVVVTPTTLESGKSVVEPIVKVLAREGGEEGSTEENVTEEVSTETSTDDAEGQYVPDNAEKLFDDGSYRPEHF